MKSTQPITTEEFKESDNGDLNYKLLNVLIVIMTSINIYKGFIKELCTRIYEEQLACTNFFAECLKLEFFNKIIKNSELNFDNLFTENSNKTNAEYFKFYIHELDHCYNIHSAMRNMHHFLKSNNWIKIFKDLLIIESEKDISILKLTNPFRDYYKGIKGKLKILKLLCPPEIYKIKFEKAAEKIKQHMLSSREGEQNKQKPLKANKIGIKSQQTWLTTYQDSEIVRAIAKASLKKNNH